MKYRSTAGATSSYLSLESFFLSFLVAAAAAFRGFLSCQSHTVGAGETIGARSEEPTTTTTIWQSNANGNFHVNLGRNKHKALIFLKVPAYFFLCCLLGQPARPACYQKSPPVSNGLVLSLYCVVVLLLLEYLVCGSFIFLGRRSRSLIG